MNSNGNSFTLLAVLKSLPETSWNLENERDNKNETTNYPQILRDKSLASFVQTSTAIIKTFQKKLFLTSREVRKQHKFSALIANSA